MIITATIQFALLLTTLVGTAWNLYQTGKAKAARSRRPAITCQVKIFRPDETSDAIPMRRAA